MTTRPRLRLGRHLLPGIAAIGVFVVLAVAVLRSTFEEAQGLPADESIVANIGFALLDLDQLTTIDVAGFLVAFIAVAVVLDAALGAAVMLASRDEEYDGGND